MTLLRLAGLLVACLGLQVAWAQTDAVAQAQRQHISAERSRAEADFLQQELACQSRFAVQACVDQIAAQRRILERELTRKEASLNAAERQQRAQEQLQRSAEKERDYQARAAELTGDATSERLQAQQEKQQAHRKVAPAPASSAASKPLPPAPTAAEQASLREAYTSKQQAAQERRRTREKRLRESTEKSPVLPTPK
jgi:colicin import membrane protein